MKVHCEEPTRHSNCWLTSQYFAIHTMPANHTSHQITIQGHTNKAIIGMYKRDLQAKVIPQCSWTATSRLEQNTGVCCLWYCIEIFQNIFTENGESRFLQDMTRKMACDRKWLDDNKERLPVRLFFFCRSDPIFKAAPFRYMAGTLICWYIIKNKEIEVKAHHHPNWLSLKETSSLLTSNSKD